MTVSLKTLGAVLIVLGAAVLLVGRNFPGVWIYTLILVIFGSSLFVKGKKPGSKGKKASDKKASEEEG